MTAARGVVSRFPLTHDAQIWLNELFMSGKERPTPVQDLVRSALELHAEYTTWDASDLLALTRIRSNRKT